MLLSVIKYFRGYVYVRLTGYAPERFLNLCGNHDILIWNLAPCEDGYCFCISIDGFRRLKPILKKTRTQVRILRKKGIPFSVHRYRKRKVFVFGIFLLIGLLYYMSGFIWNIEVNGNSYLTEEIILDFLAEENCSFGTKKKEIDCSKLEESLRSRYSEVIWTSIKIYGTKMTVDIQENLLPEENYVKTEDTIYDIVSSADGIITEMITRNGTPLVAAGNEIKKGDILVSGRLEVFGDDGEVAQYLYQSADADIYATVVYNYEDTINADYIDKVKTGEQKQDYELRIFGTVLKNPFFRMDFEHYQTVADTSQFHFTDNFYIPVYFTEKTYEEYENVPKTYTEEEIKKLAAKNLSQYLTDLEEKGIQIIEKNVIIERKNQTYVVHGTITVVQSVVSYQPTEILSITSEERQGTDESD